MDLHPGQPLETRQIVSLLTEAREKTLDLVAPLTDEDLARQHSPLMSPIIWDLCHIAHFEEVWILENAETSGSGSEGLRGIYNPFENPRSGRGELELPGREEALSYMSAVRDRVLAALPTLNIRDEGPLLGDGFVFRMVLQHEYQHNETIIQTLQLKEGEPYPIPDDRGWPDRGAGDAPRGSMVRMPGGAVPIGTDDRSEAYDNERPSHLVDLDPFWIDAYPTTNGDYLAFMADGGYRNPEFWSEAGWSWLSEGEFEAPAYWFREKDRWKVRRMDRVEDVDRSRPVCHVCYHEAEAYARWAGKRLPTEIEWEAAASWDPERRVKSRYPWGDEEATPARANVAAVRFGTAPIGSYADNLSPIGCYGMIGDTWEWTSSDFRGYPGFEAFPYPEYSEVFFGDEYKVLRGGSWASRGCVVRATFRNWDYPIRRQIFSGFRCARDDT